MPRRHGIWFLIVATGVSLLALGLPLANAASSNISHSYHATTAIANGSIVSLDSNQQGYVQLADNDNASRVLGVALPTQDSLLAIDPTATTIQVAVSGTVNTLVSNVNGDIKTGNQISVSPFAGIGMAASPGGRVIGVAQTAFSRTTSGATSKQVKDKSGTSHQIEVGYVRLAIGIGTGAGTGGGGSQANFLQRVVKSLTGHTISTLRILLSLCVSLVAVVSLVTLIYASIYGSIVATGRNPLAKNAIFRTLASVMIMAFITVGVACVTIYYLLR